MEKVRAFRGLLAAGDLSLKTAVETSGFSVNDPETALDIMATVNIRASFEPNPRTNEDMKEAAHLIPVELMRDTRFTQAVTLAASPDAEARNYNYFRTERLARERE